MSAIEHGGDAVQRAGRIAGRSSVAALADGVVRRSAASVSASRALVFARRCLREFHSLPSAERTRCVLIFSTAALAGHILLAEMLPTAASPTLGLTVVALLGAGLAAGVSAK